MPTAAARACCSIGFHCRIRSVPDREFFFAVEVAGLVAGLEAACVVVSGSFGNGARVSDGNAFATDGISTLGEFVVNGPGVFSFLASGCVVSIVFGRISGAFG